MGQENGDGNFEEKQFSYGLLQVQSPAITGTTEDHCFLPVTTSQEALQKAAVNSRFIVKKTKTHKGSHASRSGQNDQDHHRCEWDWHLG